jgi:hypothetical protein
MEGIMKLDMTLEISIPKPLRYIISKSLFYIAANWAKERSGVFEELRAIDSINWKTDALKKIEAKYLESDVSKFELVGVRIIELFTQDELSRLKEIVQRVFLQDNFERNVAEIFSSDWQSTGFSRIGTIAHSARKILSGRASFGLSTLPSEISHIDVTYYRFLPSMAGIAYDIYFSKEGIEKHFELMLKQSIAPKATLLTSYFPFLKIFGFSGSGYSPGAHRKAPVWLETIVGKTHKILAGIFGSTSSRSNSIPTIEVYSLDQTIGDIRVWLEHNYRFLHDFDIDPRSVYGNDSMLFCWGEKRYRSSGRKNNRVILFPKELMKTSAGKGKPSAFTLFHQLWGHLGDWFPYLASFYLLDLINLTLENFRTEILEKMDKRSRFKIIDHASLLQKFQKDYYLLQILKQGAELTILENPNGVYSDESNLPYLSLSKSPRKEKKLLERLAEMIKEYNNQLITRNSLLENWYSAYLTTLNTSETYRLSRIAILISIIALLWSVVDGPKILSGITEFVTNLF